MSFNPSIITVTDVREKTAEWVRSVMHGQETVVTWNGEPAVYCIPMSRVPEYRAHEQRLREMADEAIRMAVSEMGA
jgi:prevent-host-death family protein